MTWDEFEKWMDIVLYRLSKAGRKEDDRAVTTIKSMMTKVEKEGVRRKGAPSPKPVSEKEKKQEPVKRRRRPTI